MTVPTSPDLPSSRDLLAERDAGQLIAPAHGLASLSDLMPSVAAALGVTSHPNTLGLPPARRYVVALVDGLGWTITQRALGHARWLGRRFAQARPITSGVPSTTATSITSLGTGRVPGQHGVVGYMFRPQKGRPVMNALTWDASVDPHTFQPHRTVLEELVGQSVAVSRVMPARHEGSGLTESALRGGRFVPMSREDDLDLRTEKTVRASREGERSLVYVYDRSVDHTGHSRGVDSDDWLIALERVDGWLADLRRSLDDDVCLVVTGDHGMVDVPFDSRLVFEEEPELVRGVDALAGEGRLRQLYTDEPDEVARRWAALLGERAWVRTREEALAEGWFGEVAPTVSDRIGDVLVAARDRWAVMSTTLPGEFTLVGMHGSLTADEMLVPLVVDHG
ncbi:alkaline phosphatase family protein [Aestuariimicrobium soli]|uniref:alkaline phosphatase family protein n=1 Tax=Aestuariimicrobium soli TaxID=2035834 RepID=UPI003EBF8055